MAPGYGSTTYDAVRRYAVTANGTTKINGSIIAGSVSGRTLVFRIFHNTTQIYTYTLPASTAANFAYEVADFAVANGDTVSWELDKTLGGSVVADVTFSGSLS